MSDRMVVLPFSKQMARILKEYRKNKTILGIKPVSLKGNKAIPLFNERIESPLGPAAGPNTQMTANLIAAYLAGARFFELKTVQKIDGEDLAKCVARPCILAYDEGYNVEWSTELTVSDAFDEYVRGWWAIKLLAKELDLGDPDSIIFNMSVGYDLAGIKLPKIDDYINHMGDASVTAVWKECKSWAEANIGEFKHIDKSFIDSISPKISDSITISTLHGCPPDEIERIAVHLIEEKGLNTFIKCNPTLLGYDFARTTLDKLGFTNIEFPDLHYREDLQWKDAVPMFRRLIALAKEKNVAFGLKLTNTTPVDITNHFLPGNEAYMSGRALFPLTINLAAKIAKEFDGKLPISFAGGADIYSVAEIFETGIYPITMATNILKPGGYQRFEQLVDAVKDIDRPETIDVNKLCALAESVFMNPHYHHEIKTTPRKKIEGKPPIFDCFTAPCRNTCPIHQDIPAYLKAIADGDLAKAAEIIIERNPLPNITGTICPHTCMDSCNRKQYEGAVDIRACKLEAAEGGLESAIKTLQPAKKAGKKAAVIGGGPGGLSAAYFLAKNGWDVDVYEKTSKFGGIVQYVIPSFRISEQAIEKDIDLIRAMGVKLFPNHEVTDISKLKEENDAVILAIGASKSVGLDLNGAESLNAVDFLGELKAGKKKNLGKDVVIIGAGNTAMDAARAAKKVDGVKSVSIVYRRDIRNMPADLEELQMAMDDGVEFKPLLAPVSLKAGKLECSVMKLGKADASGRQKPEPTGEMLEIPCTTVIASLGEKIDDDFYKKLGIAVDEKGRPVASDHVWFVGDGATGAKTVVEAIASAAKVVEKICDAKYDRYTILNNDYKGMSKRELIFPKYTGKESKRCLECAGFCGICVECCPNRANTIVNVNGKKQVLHYDTLCNECGNCAVFCPYDGHPFLDKVTYFESKADLENSENAGFAPINGGKYAIRWEGKVYETDIDGIVDEQLKEMIKAFIA